MILFEGSVFDMSALDNSSLDIGVVRTRIETYLLNNYASDYIKAGGILFRKPFIDPEKGDVVFYEPLDCASLNCNALFFDNKVLARASQEIARLTEVPESTVFIRAMSKKMNDHSATKRFITHTFDYHRINLATFPDMQPVKSSRNIQSTYNRLSRDMAPIASLLNVVPTFMNLFDWNKLVIDTIKNTDKENEQMILETIYGCLSKYYTGSPFYWLSLYYNNAPVGGFLAALDNKEAHSYLIKNDSQTFRASEMTWALCHWLRNITGFQGDLDIWNVGVTRRETYKLAFFTEKVQFPCFYNGPAVYDWMHETKDFIYA